ncbi:hypothetical protein [Flavobacterium psychrotrophum]|uniref:hypothetical protein n=1 Tax=Flavobacterium psychrotrophum TaxID=2294119 RepID=UPI000E311B03|nr:hypothetical protein [Flavobacterium psychrotrophum]
MRQGFIIFLTKLTTAFAFCSIFSTATAQEVTFWDKVQFGGGLGIGFGSGYTDVNIAPGAIYNFNEYVAAGIGLQGSYVYQKDWYSSFIYGGSLIFLGNPIPQVQLSAELQQLRVNMDYADGFNYTIPGYAGYSGGNTHDFWNTALFLGAGYRMENVTIGMRYNVLYKESDMVYSDAFMPFIRVYF